MRTPLAPRAAHRFALVAAFFGAGFLPCSLRAEDTRPATLPDLLRAIATQETAITNGRTQVRDAGAASDAAWKAFSDADRMMRERVAAEVQRAPLLRGLDYVLYTPGFASEVASTSSSRRQRRDEMRTTLAAIARDEENLRLLGRTEPHRLRPFLEYAIALTEANMRWLELLGSALEKTEAARVAREQRLRTLRERVSALKHAEQAWRDAQRERHRLLHRIGTEFSPVYVRSVRVSLDGDPRRHETWSYHGVVEQPAAATDLDRQIAFLLEGMADAGTELARHRDEFLQAEQRFADVGRRLDAAHAANTDLVRRSYYLRVGQELADSAIGIVKDGAEPASVLFEAGWRIVEAATTESFRIDEPRIDQALADYRDDIAQRLGDLTALPGEARLLNDEQWLRENADALLGRAHVFATTSDRIAAHIRGDQADELVKAAWNTGVVDGIKAFAHTAIAAGWRPDTFKGFLNSWLFEERFDPKKLANRISENTVENLPLPDGIARWLRGGDIAEDVLRPRRSALAEYTKGKIKDIALGAAVTAAKEVMNARQQAAMLETATDLALLDIEWFMRRYEYAVRGSVYHAFGRRLAECEAAIGALFEEKARQAPTRTLQVMARETISTTDVLRVQVEFSAAVDEAQLVLAGRELRQSVNRKAIVEWTIPAQTLMPGETTLAITGLTRRLGPEFGFDADPTTAARYDANVANEGDRFVGCERGADQIHRLQFAAPTLTIVHPKEGGYLPGDWLDVVCELPGSLARRRMFLTATPVDRPVEIMLPANSPASARFPAPEKSAHYKLLLLTPQQSTLHAAADFVVPVQIAREVGRSAFVRLDQVELADRGPALNLPDNPPAAGHGRIAFETRDAAAQLINPRISLRKAGSEQELTYTYGAGVREFAPDSYDIIVSAAVPFVVRNQVVREGETTVVRTGGYGRVTFLTRDALGQPTNPRVSVARAGTKTELTYTYGGNSLDLPPDDYDITITAVPNIEHPGVPIIAGHETILTTGGYGRLQLDALDALGQPIKTRVSIRRSGETDEFTYTYGGNFVDLPPNRYDVSYSYTPNIEFTSVTVEAGKVTTRTAGGYGRLQLNALDALGEPIKPRVSIRRSGEADEFTYTYGGNFIDLPPNRYDVSYSYTPNIEFTGIAVEAGKVVTRTAGGYGRLHINLLNAGGERVGSRISIRRAGSNEEFTYTYGNNFLDLPPGAYLCVHGSDEHEVRVGATLTRGAATTVTLRVR